MLGISSDLRESALDLGASRAETLVRIVLPLTGPALLGASALTFFGSAGDFITPVFLGGTNSVTFGTTISDQLRVNLDYGLGSALSFTLVLGFALFYLLLRLAMKRLRLLPPSEAGA
jgi:spermidine/putrescine transport system permease protein